MSRSRHNGCGRAKCGVCTNSVGAAARKRDAAARKRDAEGYDDGWASYDPSDPDSFESRC